jgi:hypothetical protein
MIALDDGSKFKFLFFRFGTIEASSSYHIELNIGEKVAAFFESPPPQGDARYAKKQHTAYFQVRAPDSIHSSEKAIPQAVR